MDILLIAGLWLRHSIWNDVADELERLGHRPKAIALPGVDDGSTAATLDDQLGIVLDEIERSERPMIVGHSAACTLAWMAADRRPEAVAKVALVGGFPAADGDRYADFFEPTDGVVPFPGWGPFEGPDSADLDERTRNELESGAVPVPEGVSKGLVKLTDDRRSDVPCLIVCPEFTIDQARAWIDGGEVPELAAARNVAFVDIATGHWPMVTAPAELARILSDAAEKHS